MQVNYTAIHFSFGYENKKKVETWLKSYKPQNTKVLLQTNIEIYDGVLKLCWYLVPLLKKIINLYTYYYIFLICFNLTKTPDLPLF